MTQELVLSIVAGVAALLYVGLSLYGKKYGTYVTRDNYEGAAALAAFTAVMVTLFICASFVGSLPSVFPKPTEVPK